MSTGGIKNKVILVAVTALAAIGFYAFSSQAYAKSPKFTKQEICEALADGQYDNNNFCVNTKKSRLEDVVQSLTPIYTLTLYETIAPDTVYGTNVVDAQTVFASPLGIGSSIALCPPNDEKAYLLSLAHPVSGSSVLYKMESGEKIAEKIMDVNIITLGDENIQLKKVYVNEKNDIALLAIPPASKPEVKCFPYKIGDSSKLEVGNYTYVVGYPSAAKNVREGIYSLSRALRFRT